MNISSTTSAPYSLYCTRTMISFARSLYNRNCSGRREDVARSTTALPPVRNLVADIDNMVLLGEIFPNFEAETQIGKIDLHKWLGDSWGILFSHPNDFTPVCTTELARVVKLLPEFKKLGVKVIALSCNSVDSHRKWIQDIQAYAESTAEDFPYPIIEDESRKLAIMLGMLDPDEIDSEGLPMSARAVFIIDPKKKMRLSILYPATTGRSFDEILRVVHSLQLTEKHKVATPVDWKNGDNVMVQPTVPDDEAKTLYNSIKVIALPSGKPYMRVVPQPDI